MKKMDFCPQNAEMLTASVKGHGLSKLDEELITELTYLMEECFYPKDELILNKGDFVDGIYFIIDGQVDVTMRSSYSQEFIIEKLFNRCSFGYYTVLQEKKDDKEKPRMKQRYISRADTVLLRLPVDTLQHMRTRSKVLDSILTQEAKKFPECDFSTFLTYNNQLTKKQLKIKFKRAVRRQVQLKRYKNSMNTLLNIAFFKE